MVKIGKTTRDVEIRLTDLYSTGVPLPFECEYAARVKDVDKKEKAFHTAFEPSQVTPKRVLQYQPRPGNCFFYHLWRLKILPQAFRQKQKQLIRKHLFLLKNLRRKEVPHQTILSGFKIRRYFKIWKK